MASYSDSIRNRLKLIDSQGESQTTWERLKNARDRSAALAQQEDDWQKSITERMHTAARQYGSIGSNITPIASTVTGTPDFQRFVAQIAQKESGNNYGARNNFSGALGKYQIMPFNIAPWSREALGRAVTPQQFMNSPQIQDQIATYKLQEYYNKYGPAGASIAWYAGPGAAQKYVRSGQVSTRGEAGGFPSVSNYVRSILSGLGL